MTANPQLFQILENIVRHVHGQIYKGESWVNIDIPDELAVQSGLIGYGANNIARLYLCFYNGEMVEIQRWIGMLRAWPQNITDHSRRTP